ncbi:hypothetical protein CEXT_772331, partial [Caerostris extrusa]
MTSGNPISFPPCSLNPQGVLGASLLRATSIIPDAISGRSLAVYHHNRPNGTIPGSRVRVLGTDSVCHAADSRDVLHGIRKLRQHFWRCASFPNCKQEQGAPTHHGRRFIFNLTLSPLHRWGGGGCAKKLQSHSLQLQNGWRFCDGGE